MLPLPLCVTHAIPTMLKPELCFLSCNTPTSKPCLSLRFNKVVRVLI
ncbi:Uncharacterised protein [Vibrio cholerae]|nr:Uncharacterised protein [Vibrio cholerae]